MELEEPDDEEWKKLSYTTTTSSSKYYLYPKSDGNNNSDGNKVCWVLKRGFNIGKKILVAGLVASSAPIVVPPLVVASAIGIAVSMPYAFFLASHACTETLMSRLLPRPTITHHGPNNKLILDDFDEDVIGVDTEKEEGFIECEADREIGMVGSDYGQEVVVEKEEEEEENAELQMIDCVKLGEEKEDEGMIEGNEETQMYDDVDVKIGDEKDDEGIMEGKAETQIDGFGDENDDEGIIEGNAEPQMNDDVKVGDEKEDEGIIKGNATTQTHYDDVKVGDEQEDEGIVEGNAVTQIDGFGDENEDEGIIEGDAEPQIHYDDVKVGDEKEDEGIIEVNAEAEMNDDLKVGDQKEDGGIMEGNAVTQMLDDDDVKLGDEKEDEGVMEGNEVKQMHDDDVKIGDEKEDEGIIMEGNAVTQMLEIVDEKEDEGIIEGKADSQMHDDDVKLGDEIEGLDDENGDDDIEEFKAPFEVTTVSVEEFGAEAIEEQELQRETKGLLEKIRDEGRNDAGREFLDGSTNESDHENGPVVENFEVPHEEEDRRVYKEMLESINDENKDTIYAEVESDEPVIGMLEEKEVDDKNDSQAEMAEHSEQLDGGSFQFETILAEPVGELVIEEDYSVPVTEDSSEVTGEKIDIDIVVKEEPIMQEGKLDNNISDSGNQELQLCEHNETMDLSNADATKIADERGFDLSDEKTLDPDEDAYRIDFHEESSSVVVDGNTAPTEVRVSAAEQELKPSECSLGKDVICPSAEVAFDEESIWKQIHVIRKIIGYESTAQASCADELKALYIFIGVEPPKFLNENLNDPAEINEKLHFLMSIVGVK